MAQQTMTQRAEAQNQRMKEMEQKLSEQSELLTKQMKEIERLRGVELDAERFRHMRTLPNGIDLYVGAHYEAVDRDGDGIPEDLVLVGERPDTLGLSKAEINKVMARRAALDRGEGQIAGREQALQFMASQQSTQSDGGPSSGQAVLAEAVEAAEAS